MPYPYTSVMDSGLIYPITTTCVSGKKVKAKNGGTIYGAGAALTTTFRPNISNVMTFAQDAVHANYGKNRVILAVSPTDSGNLGTMAPFAAPALFNAIQKKHYIGILLTDQLSNVTNTTAKSPGFGKSVKWANFSQGFYWINIVRFDAWTGIPTYGNSNGTLFQFQNPNGGAAVAAETKPTGAVPGNLVYLVTGKIPTNVNYGARHLY